MFNAHSRIRVAADILCRIVGLSVDKLPQVKIIQSEGEFREVCELLYRQYLKRYYCAENEREMHWSSFMCKTNARTFIGRD